MTTLAQTLCSENNVSFEQTFRYQYVISPEKMNLAGFSADRIGTHWVHVGSALLRAALTDCNGVVFGLCLGVAVDHDGRLPQEFFATGFDSTASTALDELEAYLTGLAGRYMLITHMAGQSHVHCDPVGMIGAVYAAETGRVAASTFLCIDRPVVWNPLYDREEVAQGEGSYGLSHTCDEHVFRMNANHRMDLNNFETTRFWPKAADSFSAAPTDYGAIYDEIICASRAIISRMVTLGPTSLPLTGGNDSRILMALVEPGVHEKIGQFFSHINTYANRRDAHVAASLCQAKNVPFEVHDRKVISVPRYVKRLAARRYRIASGTLTTVPKEIENGLFQSVTEDAIVMRGHQTNIMRGQYLTTADPKEWQVPRWQIRMMRLVGNGKFNADVAARFLPEFKTYYDDLPDNARARSADFIFLETLVPAALGVLFPGQDRAFFLSPFNSRRLVQLSMQPDTAYRLTNATTTDVLLRADPDIAVLPFSYELPADLSETPDVYEKCLNRIAAGVERYDNIFNEPAPVSPAQLKEF